MNLNEKRYEVIAEYPNCPYEKTAILEVDEDDGELYSNEFGYASSKSVVTEDIANKYPHLFRPLQWFEKREISDMPRYLKSGDFVTKVIEWKIGTEMAAKIEFEVKILGYETDILYQNLLSMFEPATLSDYEQFKKNEQ